MATMLKSQGTRWLGTGALIVIAVLIVPRGLAQGGSKCKPADGYTASILPYLDSLVTRSDSVFVDMRTKLGLVQSTSQNVSLVTHKPTCAAAAVAVDSLRNTPNSGRKVYVFKLGPTRYGVSDPSAPDLMFETGARMMVIYTSVWAYLTNLMH